jgi:GT2 family glycosyltransferase
VVNNGSSSEVRTWLLREEKQHPNLHSLHFDQPLGFSQAINVAFFCVMIPRALWERLSGLEEGWGTGNFEDDDFCLRTRLAGYRLGVARNIFVFHHQGATFRANEIDHDSLMEQNQLLFCDRTSRMARSWDDSNHFRKKSWSKVSVIVPIAPPVAAYTGWSEVDY